MAHAHASVLSQGPQMTPGGLEKHRSASRRLDHSRVVPQRICQTLHPLGTHRYRRHGLERQRQRNGSCWSHGLWSSHPGELGVCSNAAGRDLGFSETVNQQKRMASRPLRWYVRAQLGVLLLPAGLCLFGEAISRRIIQLLGQDRGPWFWYGTLSLICINAGIGLMIESGLLSGYPGRRAD